MATRPSQLLDLVERRQTLQDSAIEDLEERLFALSENLGRRLGASLGVDPDEVREPDGDDGRRVGRTTIEELIASLGDADAIRAAVLASSLEEVEELIDAAGLGDARGEIRKTVGRIAGIAERSVTIQGVIDAEGALDTVAAEALLGNYIETSIDDALFGTLSRQSATRIKDALTSNLGLEDMLTVARRIADSEEVSVPMAVTEARTRLAQADRFVNDVVRQSVDPDGDLMVLAYLGPADGVTRGFCDRLVNKAFEVDDFNSANNAQTPSHPRVSGGGYNCRHNIVPVSRESVEDLGLTVGTIDDVRAANDAAISARRKKGRRRKR